MPYGRYPRRMRRARKPYRSATVHVPSTIAGSIGAGAMATIVVVNPSLDAAGSASANIEASDRDRTANVGNQLGRLIITTTFRNPTATGNLEFCVMHVERSAATPAAGTHPVPSAATVSSVGMQQATRMANPGRVLYFGVLAYTPETTRNKQFSVTPAKYRMSKVRPGDYFMLLIFNRGSAAISYDYQARFKEFQ